MGDTRTLKGEKIREAILSKKGQRIEVILYHKKGVYDMYEGDKKVFSGLNFAKSILYFMEYINSLQRS